MENIFKNSKVIFEKLEPFGFKVEADRSEKKYVYQTEIVDNSFLMAVEINKLGNVSTKVVEKETNEEYVLHLVDKAEGLFVGRVKNEFEEVLNKIKVSCFEPFVFKTKQSQELICFIREKYDRELEFLWKKFDENAIWRRKDNAKWFGALLKVKPDRIGLNGEGIIEIVDLRAPKGDVNSIVDNVKIFPGYHMNKQSWITIPMDGRMKNSELFKLVDQSFELALGAK